MELSFRFGISNGRSEASIGLPPVEAHLAPAYFNSRVEPYAAYGAQRLIDGYAGPLFTLRRASDGTTVDVVPPSGGDYPDYSAIDTWAAGAALTVAMLHDQSGNGRHLAQDTVASQPSFDTSQRFGNACPILFDGFNRTGSEANPQVMKRLEAGGMTGLDAHSLSTFLAVQPLTSYNRLGYLAVSDASGSDRFRMFQGVTPNTLSVRVSGSSQARAALGPHVRFDPNVIGASISEGTLDIWANGTTASVGGVPGTAAPATHIYLGDCFTGNPDFNGLFRFFGGALFTERVSTGDGAAIVASLNSALSYGNGFGAAPEYNVLMIGDSIMEGTGSRLLRNMPSWLTGSLTRPHRLFNSAAHGETMGTAYAQRVGRYATTFVSGIPNVAFIQIGTNDIGNGTAASDLYANTTSPFVAYLQAVGYKVAVCTLTPRQRADWTAAQEARRTDYNALVVGNAAGADLVLDLTDNPTMGSSAANTSLYGDNLHPTSLGYRYLAGAPSGTHADPATYYAALTAVLRTTALGPVYVP